MKGLEMSVSSKNIYFTADWHIGHANVIKFDNRPFKDLDHMHKVLVNNYNASVRDSDVCYFLGDVGLANKDLMGPIIRQLNGTKVLIVGNHDKGYNAMYDCGFDVVMHQGAIYLGKNRITMSHCPMLGVFREDTTNMRGSVTGSLWHGDHKHQAYSVQDEGQFHLHGHIHSPNGGQSQRILDRQMDVGVPSNSYRPVSRSQIESWIARYLADQKGKSE